MSKILYVEDEPFLAKIVKESLETRGYEICHTMDGTFAAREFQNFKPDLCILDVMLPGKDGFMIAQEIRKMDADVPIIFLTAKDQQDDLLKGFNVGGNDYLKKPFSMEELIVRVENLINLTVGKEKKMHGTYAMASFIFHPGKLSLKRGDKVIKLSHKENEIVKLFAQNINGSIDRQLILETVWGSDSIFNSRTLDVYIRKLRKIFSEDEAVQIITLKSIGYHFMVE